jgi:hypothetical protein
MLPHSSFAERLPRSPTLKMAGDEIFQVFKPYYEMGGILAFVVYDGVQNAEIDSLAVIHEALANTGNVHEGAFKKTQESANFRSSVFW